MKKTFALSVVALTFAACNNSTPQQTDNAAEQPATTEKTPMVGGDRDEHGCIGSAGYTWSALRGECIQVFEVGTRLNPVDIKEEEAVFSAFIVSKDGDNSQVELFITNEEQSLILKQEADGIFKNGKYTYNAQTKELSIDGKVAYKN
ncbi:hypothetical protein [Capnocytophaga gingivalis]|uniref:Lipoprotein n=1 Tax=Capnocytophaga gingivalis TaxID=1017 RepID=A0ABU5ZAB3_9FLAO|nr:hypothetical protein [Capnocytophaga gingivalis]MEB3075895.1 hypothetical protein [Capnocytophaga gingivalis]